MKNVWKIDISDEGVAELVGSEIYIFVIPLVFVGTLRHGADVGTEE